MALNPMFSLKALEATQGNTILDDTPSSFVVSVDMHRYSYFVIK